MKKTTLFILFLGAICHGQIKLYPIEGKTAKAKGVSLTLYHPSDTKIAGLFTMGTVASVLTPFVVNYGLELLGALNQRNEQDYTARYVANNIFPIDFDIIDGEEVIFMSGLEYYPKGSNSIFPKPAARYQFNIKASEEKILIGLEGAVEDYLPVKFKKKYDYIFETFDITVIADVSTTLKKGKPDEVTVSSRINLGTARINREIVSYNEGLVRPTEPTTLSFGKYDSNGNPRKIEKLYLTCTQTYLNPFGVTNNSFNSFLESTQDNTEALLVRLLNGPDE